MVPISYISHMVELFVVSTESLPTKFACKNVYIQFSEFCLYSFIL